jgi:hypothetical protein
MINKEAVWNKSGGICWYCGIQTKRMKIEHVQIGDETKGKYLNQFCSDHIIPLSRGGSNEIDNLVPSCRKCNSRKGIKTLDEFRYRQAWRFLVGFVFSKKQLMYLRSIGVVLPPLEKSFKFWFEEQI